ncbi:MAG TPA: uroporphyrinogen decarboxylase family protein [Aggregatilineaceae bacterium]|nr:uroporphyrinogen decarboxylase family protein [Aggregatilineaceae bacterium]
MALNAKERLRRALRHEPVDRIPTQINYTDSMGARMARYFGVSAAALPEFLGNHLIRVDLSFPQHLNETGAIHYDWWGAGHDTGEEGYFIAYHPLKANRDLDAFSWPDPGQEGLMEKAWATIEHYGATHFIVPNLGFALFERAWTLRGLEELLVDMSEDPAYVEALFDRIVEIQLALVRRYLALGVDGGYFGDDYGAQKGLLFSPRMWRQYIKPRLSRLFAPFKESDLPILLHSDGQIQPILPDLIEIGVTALNPVQPEVLDHRWLHESFGGKLAFYGGISTQTVLPHGTPDDVQNAVADCVRDLAPDGTGLLLAPSHRLMSDIPLENVEAMLAAFRPD